MDFEWKGADADHLHSPAQARHRRAAWVCPPANLRIEHAAFVDSST